MLSIVNSLNVIKYMNKKIKIEINLHIKISYQKFMCLIETDRS